VKIQVKVIMEEEEEEETRSSKTSESYHKTKQMTST
jgi:hypothetical protein